MLPYLWMLISAFAFAGMSEIAGALNRLGCHWLIVALARTSLALAFTACLAVVHRTRLVFWGPRTLWVRSLAGSVSLLCSFYALHRLPPSDAIAITNMFPIWVAVFSWPLLGERPGPIVWIAVLSSVIGAVLMNRPTADGFDLGAIAALVSSVLSAIVVIGLNLLQGLPSQAIVVHFSGVATLFTLVTLPRAGVTAEHFTSLSASSILLLLGLGLAATVGQLFLTKAFASGTASKVSVVALSQVVFCALFEFCFLRQRFHPATIIGMILVIGPTAWMMLRRDQSRLSTVTAVSNE
jgi:drug/metabolite transporter (DMT)-like permease